MNWFKIVSLNNEKAVQGLFHYKDAAYHYRNSFYKDEMVSCLSL